ncbi:MAG: single-stranded DNA-binding protein [Treponema sp.]|nr:single-stranded DNA-binding protein [Treponema sp.]
MASDINSVILVGRLTRDAELSYLPSGTAALAFSIAVNRSKKEGEQWVEEANFFDISYISKSAENFKQYLVKGKQVGIQGSLKQDRWQDKESGQNRSKIKIMASSVQLLGGRSDSGAGGGYSGSGYQSGGQARSAYTPQPMSPQADSYGGDNGGFPEDVPF